MSNWVWLFMTVVFAVGTLMFLVQLVCALRDQRVKNPVSSVKFIAYALKLSGEREFLTKRNSPIGYWAAVAFIGFIFVCGSFSAIAMGLVFVGILK